MDETLQKTLVVWFAFALVLGPLLTRSSIRRSRVHGGIIAHVFHFVGAFSLVGVVPAIFAALVFGGGFRLAFPLGLTLLLVSMFSLVLFAIVERPALQAYQETHEEKGWTEEDARASGL